MFDSLKKKLSSAIKNLVNREETEEAAEQKAEAQPAQVIATPPKPEIVQERVSEKPKIEEKQVQKEKPEQPKAETIIPQKQKAEPEPKKEESPAHKPPVEKVHMEKKEKPEPLLKVSLGTKIKGVILRSVTLNESEIDQFTENVKISLLESDVSYETTERISSTIGDELRSTKISASSIDASLRNVLRDSLLSVLKKNESGIDLFKFVTERISQNNIPIKILFLGANGTGKTTTMAKIASHLKKSNVTCVLSASDTFRAAAIEQTEYHANKIGVPVVKSGYGADPASVAFDAIAFAKARGIQVVLIDSAGRQETNKNLINEIHKIVRIAKPDITLFVGESTSGNALPEQIKEFNKIAKIDGVVLTKLDCDAKGGNTISIADTTGIPILFFGIGESYDALRAYDSDFILNAIVPNN
jgi:fused signal recognition particle receptor